MLRIQNLLLHSQTHSQPTPNPHKKSPYNFISKISGATVAASAELSIFFPFDTMAKRLMNNKLERTKLGQTAKTGQISLNETLFKKAHDKSNLQKFKSLYKGFSLGFRYKISQRVIKFAGQPLIINPIDDHFGESLKRTFGKKNAGVAMHAAAGFITGILEVPFLQPVDVVKIRSQTHDQKYKLWNAIKTEGLFNLYRASGVTAFRNGIGSIGLFGTQEYLKQKYKSVDHHTTSIWQRAAISSASAIVSIGISHPADVVRTRVISSKEKTFATTTFFQIMREQGTKEFIKGLPTKIGVTFPKVAFTMTLVSEVSDYIEKVIMDKSPQLK